MSVKPANAGAVTRLLVKAGMRKSERHASGMVRGWADFTEGVKCEQGMIRNRKRVRQGSYRDGSPRYTFQANNTPTGKVHVEYVLSSGRRNSTTAEDNEKRQAAMDKAAEILRAKGFVVEHRTTGGATAAPMLTVYRTDEAGEVVKW